MKIEVPKQQSKMLECLRFVCKAASKDDTRYALKGVKVEKDRFVATDGRRLHIADIEHDYEPGIYEIIKNNRTTVILLKLDDPGNFPKYEDILPDHKNFFESRGAGTTPDCVVAAYGLAQKGICCNPGYLEDALGSYDPFTVYYGDKDRAVLIKRDKNKQAVVMPVKIERIEFFEPEPETE